MKKKKSRTKIALRLRKKKAREITTETAAVKYAASLGWLGRKYKIPGKRFGLDRIFMKNDRLFFIEFKKLKKEPSPGQVREMAKLDEYGITHHWTDNFDDAKAIIDSHESRIQ